MGGSTGAKGSCPKPGNSVVPEFTAHTAKHLFKGEVNWKGDAVGVHSDSAIAAGTAQLTSKQTPVGPDPPGLYKARVEVKDANGNWVQKGPPSTFFPKTWSEQKIKEEVSGAFKNKTQKPDGSWSGTSPSGVVINGYLDKKTGNIATAYPVAPKK